VVGFLLLQVCTCVEIICCFDGVVVEGCVILLMVWGVCVCFSELGEIVDELIRWFVWVELEGWVVVVVLSDCEVVDGVCVSGVYVVFSVVFVWLFDCG